jgi:nicotinamide-nucleotide adenylyltransferase
LSVCDELLVLVGSSQEKGTERNPFDVFDRINVIRDVYENKIKVGYIPDLTHEDDISYEWGRHVLDTVNQWSTIYGINMLPDVTIYGNDENRAGWYNPDHISRLAQLVIPRAEIKISATELREALVFNQRKKWENYTNPKIHALYQDLRSQLLHVPFYKEMETIYNAR